MTILQQLNESGTRPVGASTAGRPEGASPAQGAQEERATTPAEGPLEGPENLSKFHHVGLLIDPRVKVEKWNGCLHKAPILAQR